MTAWSCGSSLVAIAFAALWLWERHKRKAERQAMLSTWETAIHVQIGEIKTCAKLLEAT